MAKYRILSLDGGGIRGVVSLVILERLEAAKPGWLADVDLIAGTSTGGIIALGLAKGLSLVTLKNLYVDHADEIFDRTWIDKVVDLGNTIGSKYDNRKLAKLLKQTLGTTTLGDLTRRVLIPTFDLDYKDEKHNTRMWKPKLFHNFPTPDGAEDRVMEASLVALYTSAGPTYFPSVDGYIDGGVYANNPSMTALAQAIDEVNTGDEAVSLKDIALLSIGTGLSQQYIKGTQLDWGLGQWAKPIIDLMMDGSMGVADYQCTKLLGPRYHRAAPVFPATRLVPLDATDQVAFMLAFAGSCDLTEAIAWLQSKW